MVKFVDWMSDKSYKKGINDEWIQISTGKCDVVAKNTIDLYNLYKKENDVN